MKKLKENKQNPFKRKYHQTTFASEELITKPLRKKLTTPTTNYPQLFKRIKFLMVTGALTEKSLRKFLIKEEKRYKKF